MAHDSKPERPPNHVLGELTSVAGRHTTSERNRPALDEVSLVAGENTHTFRIPRPVDAVEVTVRKLRRATYTEFDVCPTCLATGAMTAEHVPPESLGGGVLTRTCERCNNEAGSRLEPELLDWYEHALRGTAFTGEGVRGSRRGPRILHRQNEQGEFGLIFDIGRYDPAVSDILEGGEFSFNYREPDIGRVKVAVLKSAYLAACALLGSIPEQGKAEAIRAELAAALETPGRSVLEPGPIADSIRFFRTYRPAVAGETWLVADVTESHTRFMLSLADVLVVDWPLEPLRIVRTESRVGIAWQADATDPATPR